MIHYYLTNSEDVIGAAIVTGFLGIIFGVTAVITMVSELRGQATVSVNERKFMRVALGILVWGILSLTVSPAAILVFLVWLPQVIKSLVGNVWFAIQVALSDETSTDDADGN